MTRSIIICDDHSLLVQTLKDFIEIKAPDIQVVATDNFNQLISLFESNEKFDLAIIDFRMPGINDMKIVKQLIKNPKNIPVAVMSGLAGHSEIVEFIELGAIGFIPKTLSSMGFVNAINLMLCGETYIPATLIEKKHKISHNDFEITQREEDVLRKLHLGYSNKEIAQQLNIEEITVKVYVSKLCKLLNAKNRTQVVVEALSRKMVS